MLLSSGHLLSYTVTIMSLFQKISAQDEVTILPWNTTTFQVPSIGSGSSSTSSALPQPSSVQPLITVSSPMPGNAASSVSQSQDIPSFDPSPSPTDIPVETAVSPTVSIASQVVMYEALFPHLVRCETDDCSTSINGTPGITSESQTIVSESIATTFVTSSPQSAIPSTSASVTGNINNPQEETSVAASSALPTFTGGADSGTLDLMEGGVLGLFGIVVALL
mgnify:CR=1 FL=1